MPAEMEPGARVAPVRCSLEAHFVGVLLLGLLKVRLLFSSNDQTQQIQIFLLCVTYRQYAHDFFSVRLGDYRKYLTLLNFDAGYSEIRSTAAVAREWTP
jgi:hypothetical protein